MKQVCNLQEPSIGWGLRVTSRLGAYDSLFRQDVIHWYFSATLFFLACFGYGALGLLSFLALVNRLVAGR